MKVKVDETELLSKMLVEIRGLGKDFSCDMPRPFGAGKMALEVKPIIKEVWGSDKP